MKFTKMQGIGNDYVYINCFSEKVENPSSLSVKVSDRHFGVGSDGLILIKPSDKADFRMDMYNADGSQAQMCGNGIRCVGKYVYDNGLTDRTEISVETLAGIKYLKLNVKDGAVRTVTVDMGSPELEPFKIPVKLDGDIIKQRPVTIGGKEYSITCVSMGNPHCITYDIHDVDNMDIEKTGPEFENDEIFPEHVNAEFIEVMDRKTLKMRVWERGSGETLACGTGACAAAVATILNGLCDDTVTVKLRGGDLRITWDREKNRVYMEGPAETVFTGELSNI